MADKEFVRTRIDDGVVLVTLARPPVNSLSVQLYDEIRDTFNEISQNEDIRAVVLTGEGKVFCGGNDLNVFVDLNFSDAEKFLATVRICFNALYDCAVPVIAAINGAAVGGGLVLASLSDIRIAAQDMFFALPEIDVGVLGGSKHTMRILSQGMTRLLMYTGWRISADEAFRLNMVEKVVPTADVVEEAMAIARAIAEKSPRAIRLAKIGLNRIEHMNLKEAYEFECTLTAAVRRTSEARQGALQSLEKRHPGRKMFR